MEVYDYKEAEFKMTKICAFSDIHGQLGFKIEPCDVALICGDIMPLEIQRDILGSMEWLRDVFVPWCEELPCEKVLFIGGNHDFVCEKNWQGIKRMLEGNDKVAHLYLETYEFNGLKIFGTPFCHKFYNWAFMPTDEFQDEYYNKLIDEGLEADIVMSHDAPYGTSDVIMQEGWPYADGSHIGSVPLRDFILKLKPKVVVKGHLHSTNREVEKLGDTDVRSVSLLNENYNMVYKPTYFEI